MYRLLGYQREKNNYINKYKLAVLSKSEAGGFPVTFKSYKFLKKANLCSFIHMYVWSVQHYICTNLSFTRKSQLSNSEPKH